MTLSAQQCKLDPTQMELSCTTMAGDELVQLSGIPGDLSLIQAVEMLKEGRHLVDWLQEKAGN